MRNTIFVLFFSIGCISCNGDESQQITDEVSPVDTVSLETDLQNDTLPIADETPSYSSFEDYMKITTRAELEAAFGDHIKDDTLWYNEGTERRLVSKINNPKNGQQLTFVWQEENPNLVGDIEAHYHQYDDDFQPLENQELTSEKGVYLGMPMQKLKEWNKKPFDFSGFGWDFGGGVLSDDGQLGTCDFSIFLMMDENAPAEVYAGLTGDRIFSSDDEAVQNAPIYISSFHYYANSDQ